MVSQKKQSRFQRLKFVAKTFLAKIKSDQLSTRAASIAFQGLFAIIPLLAVGYWVLSWFGGIADLSKALEEFVANYFAAGVSDQLAQYLRQIENKISPQAIGVFGLLAFAYTGLNTIGTVEEGLNQIWGVTRSRTIKERLILYVPMFFLGVLGLAGSLVMTSYLAKLSTDVVVIGKGFAVALTLAPYFITSLLFSVVFFVVPHTAVSWSASWRAGFVTGLLLEILKQGYTYYANYSLQSSVYGALAALPILFLWLSLSSLLFLIGAELCYFLDQKKNGVFHFAGMEAELSVPMLVKILEVFEAQRKTGQPFLTIRDVVHRMQWDQSSVIRHVHFLSENGYLEHRGRTEIGRECFKAKFADLPGAEQDLVRKMNQSSYENFRLDAFSLSARV